MHHRQGAAGAQHALRACRLTFSIFGAAPWLPTTATSTWSAPSSDPHAVAVEVMECEWRPVIDVLGDRSGFDAAVITRRADGSHHLVGVEVKYTEMFNRTIYNSDGYLQVARAPSGWFHPGTAPLAARPQHQPQPGAPACSPPPASTTRSWA